MYALNGESAPFTNANRVDLARVKCTSGVERGVTVLKEKIM
jgi:hypothetical protein